MKLTLKMKKRLFQKPTCVLVVNGAGVATLTAGGVETVEIAERERYYVTLADKAYGAISVLIPEGDAMTLTIDRHQRSYSLDIEGGRLETLSLARLFSAMCDEGQLLNLVPWEKNAFYGFLYLDLYRKDAVLESAYVLEMRDALEALGLPKLSARLARAIEACELVLPLDPLKKLTPEEESAIVESYHILWSEAERADADEQARTLTRIYDYIWEQQRNGVSE